MSTLQSTLTQGRRRALWAGTLWPPIYVLIFFVIWLVTAISMAGAAGLTQLLQDPTPLLAFLSVYLLGFGAIAIVHVFTMVLQIAMVFVHVWLVLNADLDATERVLWVLLVVFTGFIGQILFLHTVVDGRAARNEPA